MILTMLQYLKDQTEYLWTQFPPTEKVVEMLKAELNIVEESESETPEKNADEVEGTASPTAQLNT